MSHEAFLSAQHVSKNFGGLTAVRNVSLVIPKGEIRGLIGPNGAGKTTFFNLVSGVYAPTSGDIRFQGRSIAGLKPHQICRLGIGRTLQVTRPFSGLSVLDNVVVGAIYGKERELSVAEARAEAGRVLQLVGLASKQDFMPSDLTVADKKRLELARALATRPALLLLDEVMAGLNPTEMGEIVALVRRINESGTTLLVVEHVMRAIMNLAHRITVFHHGEVIAEGAPQEIAKDARVIESYLGEEYVVA